MKNEVSASRLHEREERLEEPRRVRMGEEGLVGLGIAEVEMGEGGESQMPLGR